MAGGAAVATICEHTFVRWENQEVEKDDQARLPGYDAGAVVRTFDAPEALNTRFYEVRAKSALNHVPKSSRVPFEWTINPYRGCSHACIYCVAGETPILMADGSTREIAALKPGDSIYGTVRSGSHRHYVKTEVLAHWSTTKPAYRVMLEDGTELVASGDHRFLSDRGWKHVTGAEQGSVDRPSLTMNDTLMGVGDLGATIEMGIEGQTVDTRARVVAIEPLGTDLPLYDITTGTGDFIADGVVSHNCFARPTHEYLDFNAGRDFEREIVVKVNLPEVLRAELARPSWKGELIALGTNTDPYQWVEGRYKLMRGVWEAMRDFSNRCSILTKSPLLLRDTDLLLEIAARTRVSACFSVPTLDEKAWRATEPHTPHPRARLEAVAELNRIGIPTGVLIAPLMPGINDAPGQVEEIVRIADEAGATSIGGQALFLRGSTRDVFMDWLQAKRPDLIQRYEELYARGAYVPARERRALEARLPGRRRAHADERFQRPPPPPTRPPGRPREELRQTTLF